MWFSLKIYWVPLKKKKDNSAFLDNMFYLKNKNNFKTFLNHKNINSAHNGLNLDYVLFIYKKNILIKVLIRFCII